MKYGKDDFFNERVVRSRTRAWRPIFLFFGFRAQGLQESSRRAPGELQESSGRAPGELQESSRAPGELQDSLLQESWRRAPGELQESSRRARRLRKRSKVIDWGRQSLLVQGLGYILSITNGYSPSGLKHSHSSESP